MDEVLGAIVTGRWAMWHDSIQIIRTRMVDGRMYDQFEYLYGRVLRHDAAMLRSRPRLDLIAAFKATMPPSAAWW